MTRGLFYVRALLLCSACSHLGSGGWDALASLAASQSPAAHYLRAVSVDKGGGGLVESSSALCQRLQWRHTSRGSSSLTSSMRWLSRRNMLRSCPHHRRGGVSVLRPECGRQGRRTRGRGTLSAALVSSQLFDSLKRSCLSCARVAASPAAAARNAASGVGGHGPESNIATTTSGAHFRKWVRARRPRTSLPQHGHVCRVSSASAALKRGACGGGDCRLALVRSGDAAAPLHVRMHSCALFGRAERKNATRIGALSGPAWRTWSAFQEARTLVPGACVHHGRPCACALSAAVLSQTRGRLLVRSHTTPASREGSALP